MRLDWERKTIWRKYAEQINELKKKGNGYAAVRAKEEERRYELQINSNYKEVVYTNRLIAKARRLRVPVPRQPSWNEEHEALEPSADWNEGLQEMIWLSDEGIRKVREGIRAEEKWKREGRSHWIGFLTALGGVIGTLIGFVAVLFK